MGRFVGILGILVLLGAAYAMSRDRAAISRRVVAAGLGLQLLFAVLILKTPAGRPFFAAVDGFVRKLLNFADEGTAFIFRSVQTGNVEPALFNLAFRFLPVIIFLSSLMAVLYHLGVMQPVVRGIAIVMRRFMGTSGSETLSVSANIFVGQTEAPLVVRPFLGRMTSSELMAVMTGGFATMTGGLLAVYAGMLKDVPGIAGHLMAASIMSAPAALVMAKIVFPETETPETLGDARIEMERPDANLIQAMTRGAAEGLTLVMNVAVMLVAFVAFVAMINGALDLAGLSVQQILGWAFRPLAWSMGAPWAEADVLGRLMGEKVVLTEFIAYHNLSELHAAGALSDRTAVIASYALCGFANFASIGVQVGGIGGLAPERRGDLAKLALRAMVAGALASWLTAALAGMMV